MYWLTVTIDEVWYCIEIELEDVRVTVTEVCNEEGIDVDEDEREDTVEVSKDLVVDATVVDGVAMSGDSVVTGNSATLDDGTELDRNTGLTIDDVGAKEEVNERNVEGNVDDDKDDGMYFGDDLIDEGNEDDNCS